MSSKLGLREVNAYNKDAINKAAFMPEETEEDNLFSFGGTVEASPRKHTGKLVEVNKGNKAGINKQRENLFDGISNVNSKMDRMPTASKVSQPAEQISTSFGDAVMAQTYGLGFTPVRQLTPTQIDQNRTGLGLPTLYGGSSTTQNPTNTIMHNTGLVGADTMITPNSAGYRAPINFKLSNPLVPVIAVPTSSASTRPRKGVVQTTLDITKEVVKQMQPQNSTKSEEKQGTATSKVVKPDPKIIDPKMVILPGEEFSGKLSNWDKLAKADWEQQKSMTNPVREYTEDFRYGNGPSITEQYQDSKGGWFGMSKKANPFSKGNIGGTMKGIGMAAASIGDQIDTGDPRGLFDTLDPVYHLAGGRESAVGNAMSDAGVALTKSGVPIAMLAGAALKVVGGLTNAAFGIKEDKEMRKRADQSISSNFGFRSNAAAFDDIKGPASMTNTNIYEGGWFSGGKADEKNAQYARDMANAYSWADRSIQNNVRNISADQVEDFMRNYAALGGYFDRSKRKKRLRRR